jgi:hypothetical protein
MLHARNRGISRREVDNSVPTLGDDLVPEDDAILTHAVHETISQGMTSENTRKNYRNRITKIISHLKSHFPDYYEIGVKKVSQADLADRTSGPRPKASEYACVAGDSF